MSSFYSIYSVVDINPTRNYLVDIEQTTKQLLDQEDTDKDNRITIEDKGPKSFSLGTLTSEGFAKYPLRGNYVVSSLLQELSLAATSKQRKMVIQESELCQNPVERINKMISKYFWTSLTRTIDRKGLELICLDAKQSSSIKQLRVYVPDSDPIAYEYFSTLPLQGLDIIQISKDLSSERIEEILSNPGILSLQLRKNAITGQLEGVPFIVPGGRFNEMYGWDSYFIILGLLQDGMVELAKGMIENLIYEIIHYGKILNANRSYYLARSQPPFLTDAILKVYERLDKSDENLNWLVECFKWAIHEYKNVWMSEPRFIASHGLSRYCSEYIGVSPETEPSHFDFVFSKYAKKSAMSIDEYRLLYTSGIITEPELDEYFFHDQSLRESGHDTSYSLDGVSGNLLNFDLNFLLYKYESDIFNFLQKYNSLLSEQENIDEWNAKIESRRALINKYFWNESVGLFFDYNFKTNSQSTFRSCTNYYALWCGMASKEQAERLVENLKLFEEAGGLVSGTKDSLDKFKKRSLKGPNRQWDYPYGWAPHQMLAWQGLLNYGYHLEASRLAYRWLLMITKIYSNFNGALVEKYDVVRRTHKIDVEYGNVGVDFKYVPKEGFGWVNASYRVGQTFLSKAQLKALGIMMECEKLYF